MRVVKNSQLRILNRNQWERLKETHYKFSRNRFSVVGLCMVLLVCFLAVFAPYVSPYPKHAGRFVNFEEMSQPPSLRHPCGTDLVGRDILTRIFFGFRYSLMMAVVVLGIVVPPGVMLGLVAGYHHGSWIDIIIMRVTDLFLAVPPLILALSVTSMLTPSVFNAMMAISLSWWPWFTRLVYGMASSLRNESFVRAAEAFGASRFHILLVQILPNCVSAIFTKISLDIGWVILLGATLGFVGLGAQPPTPDLGTMVAEGADYLPNLWWMAIFPALAIMIIILGFNLLGDGLRDMLALEEL